jgi:hypothetical protein
MQNGTTVSESVIKKSLETLDNIVYEATDLRRTLKTIFPSAEPQKKEATLDTLSEQKKSSIQDFLRGFQEDCVDRKSEKEPAQHDTMDDKPDVPFLLSVGFKDLGKDFYGHECGVYYLATDDTYSFGGIAMSDFSSKKEMKNFLDTYNDMCDEGKRANKALVGLAKLTAAMSL